MTRRLVTVLTLISMAVSVSAAAAPASLDNTEDSNEAGRPLVILVGVDGFRWDFLELYAEAAPNLRRIADEGVRARRLIPVFPTSTFPNFYSIATGLRPAHHGIVNNAMRDPVLQASFSARDESALTDGRWWGGEPIWVTAERQAVRTAIMFWVGSEAEIGGLRPSKWMKYDAQMPNSDRVDSVLAWLDRPFAPSLVLLYFSDLDRAGHRYGPEAKEVAHSMQEIDTSIGLLMAGLRERGIEDNTDLLIVSDHGMAAQVQSAGFSIFLADYAEMSEVTASTGASVAIYPKSSDPATAALQLATVERALRGAHPSLRVYTKHELASSFSPEADRRWPPLMAVADEGWTVRPGFRSQFVPHDSTEVRGGHGYLPDVESMHGTFVARGPSFLQGVLLDELEVIDIYVLITRILNLDPAPNDGSEVRAEGSLRSRTR